MPRSVSVEGGKMAHHNGITTDGLMSAPIDPTDETCAYLSVVTCRVNVLGCAIQSSAESREYSPTVP